MMMIRIRLSVASRTSSMLQARSRKTVKPTIMAMAAVTSCVRMAMESEARLDDLLESVDVDLEFAREEFAQLLIKTVDVGDQRQQAEQEHESYADADHCYCYCDCQAMASASSRYAR